jgi:AraC-like DNA-binding protein
MPSPPGSAASLTYLRTASLSGVELLVATNNSRIWRLFHERYCVCACSVAATTWNYRGKTNFTGDNSIGLMEPGEIHCVKSALRPSNFKAFFIDREVLGEFAHEAGIPGVPHLRVAQVCDAALFAALERAASSMETGEDPLRQQVVLVEFLARVLGHAESAPRYAVHSHAHAAIRRARDILQTRFNETVTLSQLAAASHLSRFHLVRSFTHGVGLPPHAYQIHVRIERARELLRKGMHSGQVASLVGFSDQSHFTRHFKKIMRATPSEYARGIASRKSYPSRLESPAKIA